MSSTKKKARIAGAIYVLLVITGVLSLLYIPSTYIVTGDATATANNIASSELLFRTGILIGLASQIIFVFLVLALYRLFKEINHRQALLMVTLVVVAASGGFLNTLNQVAASIFLSDADFLSVFEKPQLEALAYAFLRLESQGWQALQIFWGLWLFPFGLLVYKSRFIPKILGVLLIVAGFGYLLSSFMFFILPQYTDTTSLLATILQIGELPIVLWLVTMGATIQAGSEKQAVNA